MSLRTLTLVLFVLGAGLMIPFEEWYTRLLGSLSLLGFIVAGVFLIASPELLGREAEATPGDDPEG